MLFIIGADKKKWFKKYKSLSCSPKKCSACKIEEWENAIFEFWISQEHVGYIRTCINCNKQQTLATPKKLNDQIKLRNAIINLTHTLE